MGREEDSLLHHRRDVRTAALLHALLVIGLIVLWIADRRWSVLGYLELWVLTRIPGTS